MTGILMRNKVTIDGRELPGDGLSVSWSDPPHKEHETIQSIYDAHDRYVQIDEYARGTLEVEFVAHIDGNINDPMALFDALGMKSTYSYYDTANDKLVHSSEHYDWSEVGTLGQPVIPIEIRQIEQDSSADLDSDGTKRKIAFKFKAAGESLDDMLFTVQEAVDGDVAGWDMEIWSDDSGEPNSQLVGSSTLNVTAAGDHEPGDGAMAWAHVDDDIMGTATLTVGTDYWLVFIGTDTDPLSIGGSTNQNTDTMDVMYENALPAWNQDGSLENPTVCLRFSNSVGGQFVRFKEYDQGLSDYIEWTMEDCKVTNTGVTIESKKSVKVKLEIYSEKIQESENIS